MVEEKSRNTVYIVSTERQVGETGVLVGVCPLIDQDCKGGTTNVYRYL